MTCEEVQSKALPDGVRVGDERLVRLTEAAGRQLDKLISRENMGGFLRIRITGGGCNGLSYKLKFVPQPEPPCRSTAYTDRNVPTYPH